MANDAQGLLPPGVLEAIAEAVGMVLTKQQQPDAAVQDLPIEQSEQPQQPATPAQIGQTVGAALAPLAAPILSKAESKIKSRKLWTALGTIAALAGQASAGLNWPPAVVVCIAGVAAIYVAAQGLVDSAQRGGRDA